MASGYKDYQVGTSPEFVIMGAQQDIVTEFDGATLAPGGGADIIDYTVAANYRLYISSILLRASLPGYQRTEVTFGSYGGDIIFWDSEYNYRFDGIGGLPIPELQLFRLRLLSYETVNLTITAFMTGYLQNITQ